MNRVRHFSDYKYFYYEILFDSVCLYTPFFFETKIYTNVKTPKRKLGSFVLRKDVLKGKLFQKCTHLLYCSVLSLGGNVNTGRMSKPDMGSVFHIKKTMIYILVVGNYYMNYQNDQNLMLLTYSDTKRTLMHLFLFTNSAQKDLVSMCTQSIYDRN